MSVADDFARVVDTLRGWGFDIREESGCYGRSNGSSWSDGRPVGHVNHHYVCSLNPDQSYIDGLVANLKNGCTVNWFADVNGRGYLIGTGPMNHAGTGNSSVLNLVKKDKAPPGPATAPGDISGNQWYTGCEGQHPGDSTPWPIPLVDLMVAINAAEFLQWGYSANRAIQHYEHTNRKVDCSAAGGPGSGVAAGNEWRRRVAERMTGNIPTPPEQGDWFDMATKADLETVVRQQLNIYFSSGEGNPQTGRIQQAISHANIPGKVWDVVMPPNADGGNPEKQEAGRKARDTLAWMTTMLSRIYR